MTENNSSDENMFDSNKYHYITIHKKKLILFCIIFILIINSFLALILKSNVLFKTFPNAGLFYSYKLTYNEINRESSAFFNNLKKQFQNTNIQKGNQVSVSFPDTHIELTEYNDLLKGFFSFDDNFDFTFYIDDLEFIFKINDGRNYSILLDDYNKDIYNNAETVNYTNNYTLHLADIFKYNNKTNYTQKLSENSRYNYLRSLILNNKEVNITSDHTEIVSSFTSQEFKDIIWILTENLNSKDLAVFSRIAVALFLGDADNVYITSTLNNSDRLGNVIRSISISSDNTNNSYLNINFLDKKSLLGQIELEYNFLGMYDNFSIQTNFDALDNSLILGINDDVLSLTFENDSASILVNSNDSYFIRISDNSSDILKPKNKIIINGNKHYIEPQSLKNDALFYFFKNIYIPKETI